jgi:hypothetical protein
MQRIDHPTNTSILTSPATTESPGFFKPATVVTTDWCNAVQEEIANVIETAGYTLDKSDHTQLRVAIAATRGEWLLTQFPGATLDDKLAYALANVDSGTRILFPTVNEGSWLEFDGDHTIDCSVATDRHLELVGHNARVRYRGTGTFLSIDGSGANPQNPRTVLSGFTLQPLTEWQATGIKIQNTMFTFLDRVDVNRFGIGINLHNTNSWTEYTIIMNCRIRGNRIGILGDQTGDTNFSQRATCILNTIIATSLSPADGQGDEAAQWHYGVIVRDVSWYHGRMLGLAFGLKRTRSVGLQLDGGSIPGQMIHIEGEGNKALFTNVVGVWLKNSTLGLIPTANAATGIISIASIADGDTEEGSENEPTSRIIYDQREGITAAHLLGDLKIRGTNFYDVTPKPQNNVSYQVIPADANFATAANYVLYLNGIMDSDGLVHKHEYWIHDKDGGFRDWTHSYTPANILFYTKGFGGNIPLAISCCPYNVNLVTASALVDDDGTYYIDITEEQPRVVRINTTGTINQIRGGREGQSLTIMSLTTGSLILAHFADTNKSVLIDQADVEVDDTVVHMDGLDTKIQPGFTFKVDGDTTEYTVTACSALTVTDADITFTPKAAAAWANNAAVTVTAQGVFQLADETNWTAPHIRATRSFVYTYHALIGYFWADTGGAPSWSNSLHI